jgi:hypothetical protein
MARLGTILLLTALLSAPIPGGAEDPSPVVSWLHTLSIHVRSHEIHDSLHSLLAETLQLPRTYEPVQYGYGLDSTDSHIRPVYVTDGRASTTRDSVLLEARFGSNLTWAQLARGTAEGRVARVPAFDVPVYLLSDRALRFATSQVGIRLASSGTEIVVGYQDVDEALPSDSEAGGTHELWVLEIAQDLMGVRTGSASWRLLLSARTATSVRAHDGDRAEHAEGLDLLARQVSAGVSVAF